MYGHLPRASTVDLVEAACLPSAQAGWSVENFTGIRNISKETKRMLEVKLYNVETKEKGTVIAEG